MMREKRGQITVFVVIAILIIAVVALLGFLYTQGIILPLSEEENQVILGSQIEPLRSFAAECIERTSADALNFLGEHAGYSDFEAEGLSSIDFAGEKVIVVVKTEEGFVNRLPSKGEFEKQFTGYMSNGGGDQLDACFGNFASFKSQGFSVSPKKGEISVEITGESVNVQVVEEVMIRKGRARINVKLGSVKILSNAERVLRVANDIVNLEVNGIEFEGDEHDRYISEHPFSLKNIDIESRNYPTANQKVFLLKSIPTDPQEQEFRFYFAIDRI